MSSPSAACHFHFDDDRSSTEEETHSTPLRRRHQSSSANVSHTSGSHCHTPELLTHDKIPEWLTDNKFILTGYRANISWSQSVRSFCKWHNETMNIWTHFVGFLCVLVGLVLTAYTLSPYGIAHLHLHRPSCDLSNSTGSGNVSCVPPRTAELNMSSVFFADYLLRPSVHMEHLKDQAKDMLADFVHAVPSMREVTTTLRAKAEELSSLLEEEKLKIRNTEWFNNTRLSFMEFIQGVEDRIESIRLAAVEAKDKASHSSEVALDRFEEARAYLSQKFDVLTFARAVVHEFRLTHINESEAHPEDEHDLAYSLLPLWDEEARLHSRLPRWPVFAFMCSAMICLGCSTIFHLFSAISEAVSVKMQSLDYAGIILLITGSTVPVIFYGFYCEPFLLYFYTIVQSVIGLTGFCIVAHPYFRALRFRSLRTGVFIACGFAGVIPLTHVLIYFGTFSLPILPYLLWMGFFYLSGAFLYLYHIPECYHPGRYDHCCNSHNLWHVCVVFAIVAHYIGLMSWYQWRMVNVCE